MRNSWKQETAKNRVTVTDEGSASDMIHDCLFFLLVVLTFMVPHKKADYFS